MHTIKHKGFHSSFWEINFLLFACRPNFGEVVRTTCKVDRASYRLLSGYAFTACVHKPLRVQEARDGVRNCRQLHV